MSGGSEGAKKGTLTIFTGGTEADIERARPVPWMERGGEKPLQQPLQQPERWLINLGGPNRVIQAEYWVGNRSVGLRTTENGFIATLTNLHKGTSMSVAAKRHEKVRNETVR